jgi:hypothetical protein
LSGIKNKSDFEGEWPLEEAKPGFWEDREDREDRED